MRWVGPLFPLLLGAALLRLSIRERQRASRGLRRFPDMSQLDLLAGPAALFVYGLAFVGSAVALWVSG